MKHLIDASNKHLKTTVLICTIFILSSCGKTVKFLPSTTVPAAEGKIKINADKNRNYVISVSVQNLADPSLLETPKANYVLWMETVGNGTQNLGRIVPTKGLFSKTPRTSFETVTPFRPLRFFISAEDQVDIQYPGSLVILRSENFDKDL